MLENRLEEFNNNLVKMASITRFMLSQSIRALLEKDTKLADRILHEDEIKVNEMEIENIEEVLRMIARFQPTATDLRMLLAGILINRDLERIADHSVNIAECIEFYSKVDEENIPDEFSKIVDFVSDMLDNSVSALLNGDEDLAKEVIVSDYTANQLTDEIIQRVIAGMCDGTNSIASKMKVVFIARDLERIGDLATNIAESVLFVLESKLYLHRKEDLAKELGRTIRDNQDD
jgi:phosphate transport system protein